MPKVHGRHAVIMIDGDDISAFMNKHDFKRTADKHDVTTYGDEAHDYEGGLKDGESTLEGFYDSTASTGPAAVLDPLLGTKVPLVRRPEGTGTGLPEWTVTVLVGELVETQPVADMITWSCPVQFSSLPVKAAQA
jgi:hypothetical protein